MPDVQCIIIDENDPKLTKTLDEVYALAEADRLHSTVTIISVPSDAATPSGSSDSEDSGGSFDERVHRLGSSLVSLGVMPGLRTRVIWS